MIPLIPPRPDEDEVSTEQNEQPSVVQIEGFTTVERAELAKAYLENQGITTAVSTHWGGRTSLEVRASQARTAKRMLKGKIK